MIRQNIKQIWRSLLRYKSFTIINLLGLSIGIASVVLIFLIADYEKRFDNFHENGPSIYRVVTQAEREGRKIYEAAVPYPTAHFLRNEFPGARATEIHYSSDVTVRIGNGTPFNEKKVLFADLMFFNVFDFKGINNFIVTGNPVAALSVPGKAILPESAARKYFGNSNPIGKVLRLDNKIDVEVAAIVKDPPATTDVPFNIIVSYQSLTKEFIGGFDLDRWGFVGNGYCYVRIDNQTSVKAIERALYSVVQKNSDTERDRRTKFYLQPLSQIHFDTAFETTSIGYTVSPKYLLMLLLLGGFIILIACINYINLSTSLAFSKSKEVGIRKTIGASKMQLFFYYMSETMLLTLIAAIIGLVIVAICLPMINRLLDKSIALEQLADLRFIAGTVIGIIVISFISGVYPALILAGFKPIESLKNQLTMPGKASTIFRKLLVVVQFTTSIALIICTIVISRQMHYFSTKSLGFNKEAVVEVGLPGPDSAKIEAFRSLIQNQSGIQKISFCLGAPISDNGISTSMKAPELAADADYSVKIMAADRNYLDAYGIKLIAGRWFFDGEEKNLGSGLVVNHKFLVKTLGYKNPEDALGKKVSIGINKYNPPIIGVVQDFHTSSFQEGIKPVALMPFPIFYYAAGIRLEPGTMKNTLSGIEAAYKKVYPEYVYNLKFIDESLAKLYEQETKNYNLFKAFSAISIFICCIGLWADCLCSGKKDQGDRNSQSSWRHCCKYCCIVVEGFPDSGSDCIRSGIGDYFYS